jgi:hypothetical protein
MGECGGISSGGRTMPKAYCADIRMRSRSDRSQGRDASLSAPVLTRPESDRDAVQQTKADLRKAAERTVPRLCRRIGSFARRLSAAEALNYFRHEATRKIDLNLL